MPDNRVTIRVWDDYAHFTRPVKRKSCVPLFPTQPSYPPSARSVSFVLVVSRIRTACKQAVARPLLFARFPKREQGHPARLHSTAGTYSH